jgi:CheY-like chemotaxis protein
MPKVLVVDDDDDTRVMFKSLLEMHGYVVAVARHGREALELLRGERPCAILLDLMMPVMDGFEFRRRQLEYPAPIASIPVICVSAVASQARSLGIPCLSKPVDLGELLDTVQAYCHR